MEEKLTAKHEPVRVRIKVRSNGTGELLINGEDWSHRVCGVEFEARPGEMPLVCLLMHSTQVEVEGEAAMTTNLLADVLEEQERVSEEQEAMRRDFERDWAMWGRRRAAKEERRSGGAIC